MISTNYRYCRAEGALTVLGKNTIVDHRVVRMCLSVCPCEHVWERSDLQSQRDRKPFNTALDRYKVARFGWSNRFQLPANKRKIEKNILPQVDLINL